MAEALLSHYGEKYFRAFSAGSQPKGYVHPEVLNLLQDAEIPIDNLFSKTWDQFALPDAPKMDFIITLCHQAAGEDCPAWPGNPITAKWEPSDPVQAVERGSPKAFRSAFHLLERRIQMFIALIYGDPSREKLISSLDIIGRFTPESL